MATFQENLEHLNGIAKHFKFDKLGILTNAKDFEIELADGSWQGTYNTTQKEFAREIMEGHERYRFKPQPEYVPFESIDEIFENAYNPEVIWSIYREAPSLITDFSKGNEIQVSGNWETFKNAFKACAFYNPKTKETKPFGKLKV
jgi:hypothetical protein